METVEIPQFQFLDKVVYWFPVLQLMCPGHAGAGSTARELPTEAVEEFRTFPT